MTIGLGILFRVVGVEIGEKLAAKSKDTGVLQEEEAEGALMNFAELKHVIEEVKKECDEQVK